MIFLLPTLPEAVLPVDGGELPRVKEEEGGLEVVAEVQLRNFVTE